MKLPITSSLLVAALFAGEGWAFAQAAAQSPSVFRGAATREQRQGGLAGQLEAFHAYDDNVLAGDILLPATREVLRSLVPVLLAAPDELTAMPLIMLAPQDPAIPDQHRGRPVVKLSVAWSGESGAGERALAPLRALGAPIGDTVTWQPYPALFTPVDRDEDPT